MLGSALARRLEHGTPRRHMSQPLAEATTVKALVDVGVPADAVRGRPTAFDAAAPCSRRTALVPYALGAAARLYRALALRSASTGKTRCWPARRRFEDACMPLPASSPAAARLRALPALRRDLERRCGAARRKRWSRCSLSGGSRALSLEVGCPPTPTYAARPSPTPSRAPRTRRHRADDDDPASRPRRTSSTSAVGYA